jgi:hypothetical protein
MKRLGRDNRPIATPNQLIIMACEGYSKRARALTINDGADAEGAWIALNKPELVGDVAQQTALKFNAEREAVFRDFNEGLRGNLQPLFQTGTDRPRSMGALIRLYAKSDDFLYEVVNPIYQRATGAALPLGELHPLLNSMYIHDAQPPRNRNRQRVRAYSRERLADWQTPLEPTTLPSRFHEVAV